MVSRDKQIWHCFGCGEGGDVFSFVQKIENIEFPEALRILAQKAGIKLRKLDPTLVSQKTKLFDICKLAAEYFHKALLDSSEAKIARDYLEKRKLLKKTIIEFKLGYAPESWDRLLEFLLKRGFKENDIYLSGLEVKNDKGRLYDRFRQRLMFPIADQHANIVGFTGRILNPAKADQGGKYVNTPQTLIYNKSLVIYGLDKAKEEIKKKNLAVIVEGNMDVIASHQAGIKNVIASSGTALTLEQLKLLSRYTNNLALAFDADLAGQVAAERGIETALSLGLNIKVIQLPKEINGQAIKDPDDCIKASKESWQKAIDSAISIMEFYFAKIFNQYDKNNPEQKKEIAAKLLKQIIKLADKVEQDHWTSKLANQLDVPVNILRETLNKYLSERKKAPQEIKTQKNKIISRETLLADQLLALILKYPANLDYVIAHLEADMIPDENLKRIYKEIIVYYNNDKDFSYSQLEKLLIARDKELVNFLSPLLLLADKDFFDFTPEQIKQEIINIVNLLHKNIITKKIKQLQHLLSQAEKAKDDKQILELSKDFSALTNQLNNL